MNVPNRNKRPPFRTGVVSAAEIMANIQSSGVPDDSPFTGRMGIRDSKELRDNASKLLSKSKKKK